MASAIGWRKSSYSGGQGGNCVEIGDAGNRVLVRDTKQDGTGPTLRFSAEAWRRFAKQLKSLDSGQPITAPGFDSGGRFAF